MLESLTPQPADPYGIAKYAVEMDLHEARDMFGLDFVVFRPHNVYGERQNIGDRYRNVIGIFMNQILKGQPMTIFGDGEQTRAFTHIADVAPIIARSIERAGALGDVFNVGADKPYTVNHLASVVAAAMGVTPQVLHLEARSEVVHAFSDHSKVRRVFGDSTSSIDLEEGVRRMTAWVRTAGAKMTKMFAGIEVAKKLPPSWRQLDYLVRARHVGRDPV